jgi:hypothetical protein
MSPSFLTAIALALVGSSVSELTPTVVTQQAEQETPWPVLLGLRTAALERSWPVIDQVVLVPDGRTYLDEISKWSEKARWPVLFEDDLYAPLFVRGFAPARVVRRASLGTMPAERSDRERLIQTSAAEAIFDGSKDIIGACGARGFAPPMIVLTNADDPAWTAAAALAAGRGAPISFNSEPLGSPNDKIDAKTFALLSAELEKAADRTGLPWKGLGDAIDAFVICRDFGWKCDPDLAPGLRLEIPGGPFPTGPGQPLATLNTLGRHSDGMWWAIGSGIVGSEARSAYVAMASLFAPRRSAWLFNTYDSGPGWNDYDATAAAPILEKQGLVVQSWGRDQATLDGWRRILMGGFGSDVLFVNSHGVFTQFGLAAGGTATTRDVPVFDRPVMVHFLHSFSLEFPSSADCVGGAFLDHGAYAYFGSVYEPLLTAFVPPLLIAQRADVMVPFAVAARQLEGAFARPWRTMSYGDPLALLATQKKIGVRREPPAADGIETLRDVSSTALRAFRDSKDSASLVVALRALELCGDDSKVKQLWSLAQATDAAGGAAPFALGALFRARDFEAYAAAFAASATKSSIAKEMLWQLAVPRFTTMSDARIAALLGRNLRGPDVSMDLVSFRATAIRLLGQSGWNSICDAAHREASSDTTRERIESIR